jgi:hypothetical protein
VPGDRGNPRPGTFLKLFQRVWKSPPRPELLVKTLNGHQVIVYETRGRWNSVGQNGAKSSEKRIALNTEPAEDSSDEKRSGARSPVIYGAGRSLARGMSSN